MSGAAAGSSLELVVVRTPNWLGDTVMALPMLAALRAARPDARITLIGRWATLLAGQGVADALLPYPSARTDRRHLASAVAHEPPDVAILLPGSFESAFAARRWGARRRIAYASDGRGFFLTDALPLPSPRRHQVDEYAALLAPLGIADVAGVPQWTLAKSGAADAEVDGLLAATGLDPGRLVLELTETAVMGDPAAAARALRELRDLGVGLSLDDFGTGYSSLSYLRRFPVSSLKIDRSFVKDMSTNQSDATIVRTIIEMAHSLGFSVVAEGVETEEQAALLRLLRCEYAQGYLFARPMPAEELARLPGVTSVTARA